MSYIIYNIYFYTIIVIVIVIVFFYKNRCVKIPNVYKEWNKK